MLEIAIKQKSPFMQSCYKDDVKHFGSEHLSPTISHHEAVEKWHLAILQTS